MSQARTELKKFCKTTSIAGISKILNSKEIFLRFVWTIFLIISTGILLYFLVILFIEYSKWPVTTHFGENKNENIIFPDITVCSLNRVVNDANIRPLIKNYFKLLDDARHSNESEEEKEFAFAILNSLPALLRNLPKLNMLEKDCPDFITECIIYGKDWQRSQTCTNDFKEVWNADYYSCFTIRTSQIDKQKNSTIRGMTLVLNDGPPSREQIPYDISLGSSEGNGVRLTIHSPGTPPDLKRGFTLATGTENDVSIIQTNFDRLDKPYNPHGCTKQKYMENSSSEIYSRDHCVEYCNQVKIYQECDCVAHWFAIPKSLDDIKVCGNLSSVSLNSTENINEEMDKLMCGIIVSETPNDCDNSCLIPCSEKVYNSFVAPTSWPQNSMQLGIYERYVQNCSKTFPEVHERFAAYDYLINLRANITNSDNKSYSFSDLKAIRESFLVVKLIFEDDFPFMQVDKPLYTWDVLVGVVGGLLSLWLGISAITIVELFELVYFLIKGCIKS